MLQQRHLPNKRHIGKQAPYCAITFNNDKRRTKTIKRGGQNPEWDEEIRFTLFEDLEAVEAANDASSKAREKGENGESPPPLPPKNPEERKLVDSSEIPLPKRVKGGASLWMACFADDQREPELIGETTVDLTEVLTKGETDGDFSETSLLKKC